MKAFHFDFTLAAILTVGYFAAAGIIIWLSGVGGLFLPEIKLIVSILLGGFTTHATLAFRKLRQTNRKSKRTIPAPLAWAGIAIAGIFAFGIPALILAKAYRMGGWRPEPEDFAIVLGIVQALYNAYIPTVIAADKIND
jgi:hypothetical protein